MEKEKTEEMRRLAVFFEGLFLVVMLLMCAMIFMAGQGNVPFIFGHRVLRVVTDSMEPTIVGETCIVIEEVELEEIEVGDIITFISTSPRIYGFLNTHRVHEILADEETGEKYFITIGDASSTPDPYPVYFEQVEGRYVQELPYGDLVYRAIEFLTDQVNYFIIVILPLFLCCMSYVRQLFKALFSRPEDYEEKPMFPELEIIDLEVEDAHEEGRRN